MRYGIHLSEDKLITLTDMRFHRVDQADDQRFHVDARFSISDGAKVEGHFVLGARPGYEHLVLITVWRKEIVTERGLSELMKELRKRGCITPDDLLSLHPLYMENKLTTTVELVDELVRKKVADRVALTESEITAMKSLAIAERDEARKEAEDARKVAKQATHVVDKVERRNESLRSRVAQLEVELKQEKERARSENQVVTISSPDTLVDVLEAQLHRGSSCTILVMADGSQRYMKTATFDRDGRVTTKAGALIGQRVRTSCWDPVNEPEKWTRQGYFRNVYAAN